LEIVPDGNFARLLDVVSLSLPDLRREACVSILGCSLCWSLSVIISTHRADNLLCELGIYKQGRPPQGLLVHKAR
jgi:hypothetical protein